MFLPLVVDAGEGVKICITESDLENYPGLYLSAAEGDNRLTGTFRSIPQEDGARRTQSASDVGERA